MSESNRLQIVLNETSAEFVDWLEHAKEADKPAALQRQISILLEFEQVNVSPVEADAIRSWARKLPGWSEDYMTISEVDNSIFVSVSD